MHRSAKSLTHIGWILLMVSGVWAEADETRLAESQLSSDQAALLRKARTAIGTESTRVNSLVLHGTQLSGFNAVTAEPLSGPADLEIRLLLPDHYLNVQREGSVVRRRGFRADKPFFESERPNSGRRSASPVGPETLALFRAYTARLLLGMLADADTTMRLKLAEVDASGRSLTVAGPMGFGASLDLDPKYLPVRIRYRDSVSYPERALSAEERKAGQLPAWKQEVVEVTVSFEDRRGVDGVAIPHLIRQSAAGRRFEEIRLTRVIINPPLKPSDFATGTVSAPAWPSRNLLDPQGRRW